MSVNQFNLLREAQSLETSMDVMIIMDVELGDPCETGKLRAHKMVLAACSPMFRNHVLWWFSGSNNREAQWHFSRYLSGRVDFVYGNPSFHRIELEDVTLLDDSVTTKDSYQSSKDAAQHFL